MNFLDTFKSARRVSTPLIAVRTPDPASTIQTISSTVTDTPLISWDVVRGATGLNKSGKEEVAKLSGQDAKEVLMSPVEMLARSQNLPEKTILFFANPQFFSKDVAFIQAVWNLRDAFKSDFRTLVFISVEFTLPAELAQDVILFDEPLPNEEQLEKIILETYETVKLPAPKKAAIARIIPALRGLAAFTAEQVSAMSLNGKGIDVEQCWERKYSVVDETRALSVWRKKESFAQIKGVENVKEFLAGVFWGQEPPDVVVFMDEIEKMFAGAAGDTSGTSQGQHGAILKWMQNNNVLGVMFVGHPGAAKTAVAHACGGEFGVPVIAFDVDAAQNSLVGQTGENTRAALKVIDAMGRPLVIATCNSITSLSPELRRRFQLSTFFFDLPTDDERLAIWDFYIGKYKLDSMARPTDEGWTGAEIRTCCDLAWRLRKTLVEASKFIVPVATANPDRIESLRRQAAGKWISASHPGAYAMPEETVAKKTRAIGGL